MAAIVPGPTYSEMRDPSLLSPKWRDLATAARSDERDAGNLFNITWRRDDGSVSALALPPALTGVDASIIVLVGANFPSGSHKVGPAYATLAEAETLDGVRPGTKIVVGPSTGNFGIGTAYVSLLKGYQGLVVMPDTMSRERYERIQKYGASLDLTPGSESDVILTLERTRETYIGKNEYLVLAQFELFPNYRFHYHVTGDAALGAAAAHGNGRVAAFVSAPGSAGTLAAGDAIKARFPDSVVVALEPRECPTLYNGGQGQHRIEGIGDKMVTLIHNVRTTDYVGLIHDGDCVRGLAALHHASPILAKQLGIDRLMVAGPGGNLVDVRDCFGVSGICNIIGAIKTAKLLGLGKNDNVVTVATDRFDRYPSVLADLANREGPFTDDRLTTWSDRIYAGADASEILDVRGAEAKRRLSALKASVWSHFGYDDSFLASMQNQSFWENHVERIPEVDRQIADLRG